MTQIDIRGLVAYAIVILLVSPVVVYFCVKFGTFAFFKGRELYRKEKGDADGE